MKVDNVEMTGRMKRLVKHTALELSEMVGDALFVKHHKSDKIHPPEFILNYFSLTLQYIELLTKNIPESMRYAVETLPHSGMKVEEVRDDGKK